MDIAIKPEHNHKLIKWACIVLVALALFGWLFMQPQAQSRVSANDISVAAVEQGDLQLQVSGYGRLKSKKPRLLTAQSHATVEDILLKPGALVTPDSVILRLSDPQVVQAYRSANRVFVQIQNEYQQLEINQQRELLSQQAELEILRSALETAELEVTAMEQLVAKGIVSNIDYQRTSLQQRQLTRRLTIEQQRIAQLSSLHTANLAIAQSRIDAQQEVLALATEQLHSLEVKAGIHGVVQSLAVELGQSVTFGQQLALVGSTTDLYALLNIPQATMQQVELQQSVQINTRAGFISGVVSRIDPVINNGSVEVEVTLNSALTANARPELNIEGLIETGLRQNVLYMQKPIGAAPYTEGLLYRLNPAGDKAFATLIQFGAQTPEHIEIVSGAEHAQRFILSDMSRWKEHTTLKVL